MLEHARLALGAGAKTLLRAEVGRIGGLLLEAGLPKVELELVIRRQPDRGGKGLTGAAAKTGKRPHEPLLEQLGDLFRRPFSAGQHGPQGEIAFLALEL